MAEDSLVKAVGRARYKTLEKSKGINLNNVFSILAIPDELAILNLNQVGISLGVNSLEMTSSSYSIKKIRLTCRLTRSGKFSKEHAPIEDLDEEPFELDLSSLNRLCSDLCYEDMAVGDDHVSLLVSHKKKRKGVKKALAKVIESRIKNKQKRK